MTIKVVFGAMADPIEQQLRNQGIRVDNQIMAETVNIFQLHANAIQRLYGIGLIDDKTMTSARAKLQGWINDYLAKG